MDGQALTTPADPRQLVVFGEADPMPAWVERWENHACGRSQVGPLRVCSGPSAVCGTGDDLEAIARSAATVPVLVLPHTAAAPRRIVVALQDLPADEPVLHAATDAARALGAAVLVVHAVPTSFGERSIALPEAVGRGEELLALGARLVRRRCPTVLVGRSLVREWPHEAVAHIRETDLLILGGPHPGTRAGLGLTAQAAVAHAPGSVLLVPRSG
jgi:nucleotide-binding universal stress UspA family protein